MTEYVVVKGTNRLRKKTAPWTKTTTKVINHKYSSPRARKLSVYIGRPSKWGNPYPLVNEARRDQVCDEYEIYIATRLINADIVDEDFREFDGKNMLCYCKPKRCHGDTLLLLYNMNHQERLEWARAKVQE